jgi:hypothetical protein
MTLFAFCAIAYYPYLSCVFLIVIGIALIALKAELIPAYKLPEFCIEIFIH